MMNVANFLAPGKTNVVPAQASFDMEIRSFEEETLQKHLRETEQAVKDACEKFGTQYTLSLDRHSDVLYVPEDCKLVTDLFEVYRRLGAEPFCKSTYGGCDATWLFANGIDAVNVGTGMTNAHSTSELIAVSDLERTASLVVEMLTKT